MMGEQCFVECVLPAIKVIRSVHPGKQAPLGISSAAPSSSTTQFPPPHAAFCRASRVSTVHNHTTLLRAELSDPGRATSLGPAANFSNQCDAEWSADSISGRSTGGKRLLSSMPYVQANAMSSAWFIIHVQSRRIPMTTTCWMTLSSSHASLSK